STRGQTCNSQSQEPADRGFRNGRSDKVRGRIKKLQTGGRELIEVRVGEKKHRAGPGRGGPVRTKRAGGVAVNPESIRLRRLCHLPEARPRPRPSRNQRSFRS